MFRGGPPDALDSFSRFRPRAHPTVVFTSGIPIALHAQDRRCLTRCSPSGLGSASWFLRRFPVLSLGQPQQICTRAYCVETRLRGRTYDARKRYARVPLSKFRPRVGSSRLGLHGVAFGILHHIPVNLGSRRAPWRLSLLARFAYGRRFWRKYTSMSNGRC